MNANKEKAWEGNHNQEKGEFLAQSLSLCLRLWIHLEGKVFVGSRFFSQKNNFISFPFLCVLDFVFVSYLSLYLLSFNSKLCYYLL